MKKIGIFALTCFMGLSLIAPKVGVEVKASDNVDALVASMSTRQKITQLLMPDFRNWKADGEAGESKFQVMNSEVHEIIKENEFGGVILFAENVAQTEQTARLTYAIQEAALEGDKKIPLLIGIDQEGGIVYRLGTGTALPGNMAVGATRSAEYAKNVGQIIGSELSALGVNVNFAPSLDVNNNPKNPVIGLRSFSSNPELVSQLGVATIQGLKEFNVAGAAKHFPGHGDTGSDSHYDLPTVNKTKEELWKTELVPFQAAMNEGIDMVMTSHIMFPALDDTYPATLSKKILTNLVRGEMGYDGIVITDAMNMKAISDRYGETQASILAIEAGVDIVLMPTILRTKADVETKLNPMVDAMVAKAESDPTFMARVDESNKRVLNLKEDRGILNYENTKGSVEEQVAKSLSVVGSEANRNLERIIARDAVTVLKNENNVLPFNAKANDKILLVGAYTNEVPGMELAARRLKAEGVIAQDAQVVSATLRNGTTPLTNEEIKTLLDGVDYAVVISEVGSEAALDADNWVTKIPTQFAKEAKLLGVDLAIMSISKPYDGVNYPDADAVVAVYGAKGMDPTEGLRPDNAFGPNIPAGVEIIFGKQSAAGKLPVDLPKLDENHKMTQDIELPYGFGLTLNEADDVLALSIPETVKQGNKFNATISINEKPGITTKDYIVALQYDNTNFKAILKEGMHEEDGVLVIPKSANDVDQIIVEFEALEVGDSKQPIIALGLIDSKERIYGLDNEAYLDFKINVTKKDDGTGPIEPEKPDPVKPDPVKPDPVKPDPVQPDKKTDSAKTGVEANNAYLFYGTLTLALGAIVTVIVLNKKAKREE